MADCVDTVLRHSRLEVLEGQIERAFQRMRDAWREIGALLAVINAERLYPTETFEAYVEARWGLPRSTAYEWLLAAGVVASVNETPVTINGESRVIEPPQRVAHAVILAKLPPARQAEALYEARQMARERGASDVTTYDVKRVVFARLGEPAPRTSAELSHEREQRALCDLIRRTWPRIDAERRRELMRELDA